MRILIAPDKFKGSLSAQEVAKNIALGIRDVLPRADLDLVPVADGGDGTAEVICHALHGSWITCRAHDALGRPIDCRYAYIPAQKLAIIEMSEAAGMRRLAVGEGDPLRATTFGVGQLILDATRHHAAKIVIGLGGSATNDGGFGMARALGYRFFDADGIQLRSAVSKLRTLTRIDQPPNLVLPPIVAAADVTNPLLGKNGATRVFGPQKGATSQQVRILEASLKRLAKVATRQCSSADRREPGSGAAGGLGFGLTVFTGAKLRPGFDVVSSAINLEKHVRDADIIVTGEGSLDAQTLQGKAPAGVATLGRKLGKRVFAIVGRASERGKVRDLFDAIFALASSGSDERDSMTAAGRLLRERAREMAKML
jgi:glycerate kinase